MLFVFLRAESPHYFSQGNTLGFLIQQTSALKGQINRFANNFHHIQFHTND
jgi:hypothetical protein